MTRDALPAWRALEPRRECGEIVPHTGRRCGAHLDAAARCPICKRTPRVSHPVRRAKR